jgi:hypothetical protein
MELAGILRRRDGEGETLVAAFGLSLEVPSGATHGGIAGYTVMVVSYEHGAMIGQTLIY